MALKVQGGLLPWIEDNPRHYNAQFEAELLIDPGPVLAVQAIIAVATVLGGIRVVNPFLILDFGLVMIVFTISAGLLCVWRSSVGRISLIFELAATVLLIRFWLGIPGTLLMLTVPLIASFALVGPRYSLWTALVETLLILGLFMSGSTGIPINEALIAALTTWGVFGLALSVYHLMIRLVIWSWDQFQQSRALLDEARDRQVQLKQALVDLAHANHELALMNERVADARRSAEEAQRAKSVFVANVSHEFRTPLNMIIGLVDLVTETPYIYGNNLPAALLRDLEIVDRNCQHLSSMIDDVLDLSRVEANRMVLHKDRTSLAPLAEDALMVVQPLLEKKGIELSLDFPFDLPDVDCDSTRIRQVILNLVSNAARFTPSGTIQVSGRYQAGSVIISVADTGPGITEQDLDKIFEPFQQGSSSQAHVHEGSGLGLSISKGIVELHEGRMWVTSSIGVGTTFSFSLPTLILPHKLPHGRWIVDHWVDRTPKAELPHTTFTPRVILYDEAGDLCTALSRYADEVQFSEYGNCEEAVQATENSGVQSILVNAETPGRLLALVEQIRLQRPDVPIIGCSVPRAIRAAFEAGAMDYLTKPITRRQLIASVEKATLSPKRVLIVDDDVEAAQLMKRMLTLHFQDIQVVISANGIEALAELERDVPDLVILDILMPEMDGWQFLEQKRQRDVWRNIPVILVTAQDPQDRPPRSPILVATVSEGLNLDSLLRCSRGLAVLLSYAEREHSQGLEENPSVAPASGRIGWPQG